MRLVWDDAVIDVVADILGFETGFGEARGAVVLNRKGDFAAGIVFHNWNPESDAIEVSAAAIDTRWATRGVLKAAFGYIFDGIECQLAVSRTSEHNDVVRRLWLAFGADEYIIPRLRGRNEAEAISTLTKEAWAASRFMK